MGRRKIEIKAIKDDRNRSVTFLKRKGGLFKKAHELSVLCSVDVAVIIFGQNKKLYEYSSGNINEFLGRYQYYPGPHEHKGPADFANKGGHDEDDDDEDNIGSPGAEEASPPHHGVVVPQPFHNQPALQHIRHATASASPPMPNGMFQPQRLSTPQPQSISRPTSRNHSRRPSSNLVPQHHPPPQTSQPAGAPMNYAYQSSQGFYQQMPASGVTGLHPQQGNTHMTQHHYSNPVPSQAQMQHLYVPPADNRRQSMPPNFPMQNQERSAQGGMSQMPPRPQRPFHTPPLPEHPTTMAESRSHSIYTPIDDSRSILAQHWGVANGQAPQRNEANVKVERYVEGPRSQSIDVGSAMRNRTNGTSPRPNFAPPPAAPPRTASVSSIGGFGPPLRHDSASSDVKRPRLKVQIPSEHSDGGSATEETGGSSPRKSGNSNSTPSAKAGAAEGSHSSGVVLPPPSPSATALLSAGATGPKNPFARPPPPISTLTNTTLSYRDSETPLSALPSRFMSDGLLPSPSTFYSDWGFGQVGNNNSLASPAIYQPTPIANHGPSFRDEDPHNKRKSSEDGDGASSKRPKS